jgi:signal transduction histidine kinase
MSTDAPVRRLGLLAATVALAVWVEWLGYGGKATLAAADLAVGLAFLLSGLVVRERKGHGRIGLLFLATGLAWLLGTLAESDVAALSSVGAALLYVHRGPFAHLVLAYPTGRLDSKLDRAVVAAAYADGLVVPLAQNDVLTMALAGTVVGACAIGLRHRPPDLRRARALATAAAALVGGLLVLGSASRLTGTTSLSATTLLEAYEATLVIAAIGLAAGLLVRRPERAVVTDLVVELGAMRQSGTLRDALAQAYADPTLEIGYWLGNSYIDGEGRTMTLPPPGGDRSVTPVERGGRPVAVLVHDAAIADDPELAAAVAAAARLTASNARLQAELRAQLVELDASRRRALEAGDVQRSRLERRLSHAADLHLAEMRSALTRALRAAPPEAANALAAAVHELDEAVVEVHELARGIHPHTLVESGLPAALAELAGMAPVQVSVAVPDVRFAPTIEATAYFVCAEALANVAKYAQSDRASVGIRREDGRLTVLVADGGVGGADPARGSGLRGLADRVEAVGGRLTVTSPPSGGTAVLAEIPLEDAA